MKNRRIYSSSAFEEKAKYARAVVAGDWVIVSGTVGQDPVTGDMPDSLEAQAANSFQQIDKALKEAGASFDDIVRCGVYLSNREDVPAIVDILASTFADIRPANTTLICEIPAPGARVEIEVMAYRQD